MAWMHPDFSFQGSRPVTQGFTDPRDAEALWSSSTQSAVDPAHGPWRAIPEKVSTGSFLELMRDDRWFGTEEPGLILIVLVGIRITFVGPDTPLFTGWVYEFRVPIRCLLIDEILLLAGRLSYL